MTKIYGFTAEEYEEGSIETLVTGDGKTQFTDVHFDDGSMAIGMSYGRGQGLGTVEDYDEGTLATDVDVKWQVKFESQESVDAMIHCLLKIKNGLIIDD